MKKKVCYDALGDILEVGMSVTPIRGDSLFLGEGIIAKINYKDKITLELYDELGNNISKNANPYEYRKKRYIEKKRYTLSFLNKNGDCFHTLPLNNETVLETLPKYTKVVKLNYTHPTKKNKEGYCFASKELMVFYSLDQAYPRTIKFGSASFEYLHIDASNTLVPVDGELVECSSSEEMLATLQKIVEYFNNKYSINIEEEFEIVETSNTKKFNKNLKNKLRNLK